MRVADVKPAASADAVCTARTSRGRCGTASGLAPRHLSTCEGQQALLEELRHSAWRHLQDLGGQEGVSSSAIPRLRTLQGKVVVTTTLS